MRVCEMDPSTGMILANAVYFKGKWAQPFDIANTKSEAFHVNSTKTVDAPVMYRADFLIGQSSSEEEATLRPDRSEVLRPVIESANAFDTNFVKHVTADTKGNLVCSSLSAWMVLSMASYGAQGTTKSQMQSALALPPSDDVSKNGIEALVESFDDYKISELRVGNKIFVGQSISPKSEFRQITRDKFHSEIQNVDFTNVTAASKDINNWCATQMNGRIKDLMKPSDIDPLTDIVLANAVYFKGKWAEPFNTELTRLRAFQVNSTTAVDIPVMSRMGYYRSGEINNLKSSFIEVPYKSIGVRDALSMFILLPWAVDGLDALQEKLDKVTVDDLLSAETGTMKLSLPKFKIESEIPLKRVVQNMGMIHMFSGSADFSGIADFPQISISGMVQKAFIEVSEEGTEGAVATHVGGVALVGPPTFSVLHPFMGFIAAPRPSAPKLFTFRYTGPTDPGLHYYSNTPDYDYD